MDCESIRVAISANLDGEDAGVPVGVMRAHLDDCAECRAWRERQHALTRHARLAGYALDRDLTPRVLDALAGPANPAAGDSVPGESVPEDFWRPDVVPRDRRAEIPAARRVALALVAAAQLGITVPLLILGHDRGAGVHAAHELGSFDLALAIAFIVGVVRPKLSAGLAWPCCVAALGLAGTAIIDMIGGQTFGADEAQHLVAVAGALLLFWQARTVASRTVPAAPSLAPASPGVTDATALGDDALRAGEPGRPVARKEHVA